MFVGYSQALIELTDILRSERFSTEVTRTRTRGTAQLAAYSPLKQCEPRLKEAATSSPNNSNSHLAPPTNRLLIQFHASLSK